MEKERVKKLEGLFKGLANSRRIKILRALAKGKELRVADISEKIHLSFTATSKHLNQLYKLDILDRRQESLIVYYRIADKLSPFVERVISTVSNSRE